MSYSEILDAEIAEGSPLDNATLTKIQGNFDYLKSNIGGGGAPEWDASLYNAALDTSDQGVHTFKFAKSVDNSIRLIVKVPSGYTAGIVPSIGFFFYSKVGDNTKGLAFNISVGLIRENGSSSIESPLASYSSDAYISNKSVANAIGTINNNLSNANGFISSEQIADNDKLVVTLTRKGTSVSDTLLDDLYLIPSLTEVKFS